jgi:dihydroorotate dehydrogenase
MEVVMSDYVPLVAGIDYKMRPLISMLPAKWVTWYYSKGRREFTDLLKKEAIENPYFPPESLSRTLWGLNFRTPLMNAAGMFKNGECYELSFAQGAGGYLGGTGTYNFRHGNAKEGVYLPFVPYVKSHAASNWLGLPNDGDIKNSQRAISFVKRDGFPICWSLMSSPDLVGREKPDRLVESMRMYEKAGVDFLEINESCPNTSEGTPQENDLANRLRYLRDNFLERRQRKLPVVVKFSNDTQIDQVPALMDLLFELGFDGVNFGNTSTDYDSLWFNIDPADEKLYQWFREKFGGGVSGRPLQVRSLALCMRAVNYRNAGPPAREFHIIRTGGIANKEDLEQSERAGVSLNQWFTGYFESFARNGHMLYKSLFE